MTDTPYLTRARAWLDERFGTKPTLVMPADEQSLATLLAQVTNEADEQGFLRGYAQALEDAGMTKGLVDALIARRSLKEPSQ